MPTALVVLAAGKGTRMKSDLPKVLHEIAGAPLLVHAMQSGGVAERTIVVAGHGADLVTAAVKEFNPDAEVVVQKEQLGTGDAVKAAQCALAGFRGDVIVLYGDTPFIEPATIEKMRAARSSGRDIVVLGFNADDPGRYGRLIVGKSGKLDAIVEAKEATPEQLAVTLCNSGVIAADANRLFELVGQIKNDNASGEYYLTDIVELANAEGLSCSAVTCSEAETLGINSRAELASAEADFQKRARLKAMENGATLSAPESVYFSYDTILGRNVVIGPNVVFGPGVSVENNVEIKAFSHLEGCHVSREAVIGPYARLRPGAEISETARVGNFVEVKNAQIGIGAKINHLSYVGDAEIGENANIGAGTITCNYDGVMKHKTAIGAGAFIGSNTSIVAPRTIGAGATTGSGSVIVKDVPDEALAIARAEQINKPGMATRLKEKLRAIKARKDKV